MLERKQERHIGHRLAMVRRADEVTGHVAWTCRYCGIARHALYKWCRRCEAGPGRFEEPGVAPACEPQRHPG
jgi:transposase-like protein